MPGLQADGVAVAGSPTKRSRLSLRFFQKRETKRALDFSETQPEEPSAAEPEETTSCDQVVPVPCPSSLPCGKPESLVPFVGLNNLGNTCYLNSILQVLFYCPGFKDAIKSLYQLSKLKDRQKGDDVKSEEHGESHGDSTPVHMELLNSFYSLISSVEQLQSSFLFNPDKYNEGELATPPRRVLNTLRHLNPMYEGYLQHDAQEVLQCILAYIQEACDTIKKELRNSPDEPNQTSGECDTNIKDRATAEFLTTQEDEESVDGQLSGKRKSDTEAGNAKKKPKSQSKPKKSEEDNKPFTRSKRKSSGDITGSSVSDQKVEAEDEREGKEREKEGKEREKEGSSYAEEEKSEGTLKEANKRKKRAKLSWLKSSGKQPSIFSKFRSMGRISSHVGDRAENKGDDMKTQGPHNQGKVSSETENLCRTSAKTEELQGLDMLKRLFQGQLVLRTRCLECECYTERREDFQDISVPVQEDEGVFSDSSSEISPDPKPEQKTLKWAISQFASVERIVGQDKYFCETCHHYAEAERSLLFDRTPEVVTIHLKCFSASGSELDPYAGLSKVNTPLHTPLKLSLEEWCTRPSAPDQRHHYDLFAVVMHSGVTISSGHYTTYIRMMDLRHTVLKPQSQEEGEKEGDGDLKTLKKEDAPPPDYDDGEVSFTLSGKGKNLNNGTSMTSATSKAGGKRPSEGVGLLGGQRSIASYELGSSKQALSEKPVNMASCSASNPVQNGGVKTEKEDEAGSVKEESRVSIDLARQNLLDYEGKWMLFDDSEVRLFDEEDFLRACSPETCSTSTPYLLFYKKVSAETD
ncbi:ubiquitin carboxyl-terminal hydrolase 1 [Hoplias malabaricus]|uniref:ubiquitin carboxyl-terminal hydrolase 1 n=1 Tax=Hoplias malabaricus TaxID=27720 RepID=UPI0034620E00